MIDNSFVYEKIGVCDSLVSRESSISQPNRLVVRNIVAMDMSIFTKAKHDSMAYKFGP